MSAVEPTLGPCQTWIDTLPCSGSGGSSDDVYLAAASQLLWNWSGRQFSGSCDLVGRPCGSGGCWPVSVAAQRWRWGGEHWADESSTFLCGCVAVSQVPLSGYPVTDVSEVTIDGDVIDPDTYRLDDDHLLTRLDGWWPTCQNLRANVDEFGSFVVRYAAGIDPPAPGALACGELACWLVAMYPGVGDDCSPTTTVKAMTRQDVNYQFSDTATLPAARRLPMVAEFLDTYNPRHLPRRGAVYSPDLERYARTRGG